METIELETEGNLMRKFLWVVAVGALVVALAAPAMALDFKFSSSNRFRLYSLDGIGSEGTTVAASPFAEATTNNTNQGDVRFRPWFRVSDDNGNVVSELRLEIGDVVFGDTSKVSPNNSSGGAVGADGVNVETKWAYVDIQLPFGIPARLRGGIQGYYLPKGLLVDDDGSGIRLYGSMKPVSYDFWWLAANERQNAGGTPVGAAPSATTCTVGTATCIGPANDDIDYYAGKIDVAIASWLNPYAYGVFRTGTTGNPGNSSSSNGGWFGGGATGKLGIVSYDLDFVYGSDGRFYFDTSTLDERKGWVLDGGVELPVGPAAVGLRGMYATGDKATTTDKNEDFPDLRRGNGSVMSSYTPKGAEIFFASAGNGLFGCCTYQGGPGGTWTIGGYFTYVPVKPLTLKLDYFYIGASKKDTNFYTGKSTIGHEIALTATYQLWTGTKAWLLAGVVLPPDTGDEISTGASVDLKTAQAYAFGVQHDF